MLPSLVFAWKFALQQSVMLTFATHLFNLVITIHLYNDEMHLACHTSIFFNIRNTFCTKCPALACDFHNNVLYFHLIIIFENRSQEQTNMLSPELVENQQLYFVVQIKGYMFAVI